MVAELEARTEDGFAGLQLAALSLSGRSDKESLLLPSPAAIVISSITWLQEVVGSPIGEVQCFLLSTLSSSACALLV